MTVYSSVDNFFLRVLCGAIHARQVIERLIATDRATGLYFARHDREAFFLALPKKRRSELEGRRGLSSNGNSEPDMTVVAYSMPSCFHVLIRSLSDCIVALP